MLSYRCRVLTSNELLSESSITLCPEETNLKLESMTREVFYRPLQTSLEHKIHFRSAALQTFKRKPQVRTSSERAIFSGFGRTLRAMDSVGISTTHRNQILSSVDFYSTHTLEPCPKYLPQIRSATIKLWTNFGHQISAETKFLISCFRF